MTTVNFTIPFSLTIPYLRGRGVLATFDPADFDLYRRLIPEPLKMPDHPQVHVEIERVEEVGWPLRPYNLAFISLAVRRGPTPGWHAIMMPESKWLPVWFGRQIGFPKVVADVRLSSRGRMGGDDGEWSGEWSGYARKNGITLLALRFQGAGPVQSVRGVDVVNISDGGIEIPDYFCGAPVFQLNPPGKGHERQRGALMAMTFDVLSPLTAVGNRGTVTLTCDPSLPWAGLLPEEVTGEYLAWKGAYAIRAGLTASHVLEAEPTPVVA